MKNIYGLFFLLALLLMGCSSTYTIKDFPSKEKFYEDFNNSAQNKDVNVTLINDSSFTINDGTVLENDTLISYGKLEGKDKRSFALSDITEIRYANNDSSSASVLFKNGDKLRGENIITDHDSIYFVTMKTSIARNNIVPIDKVKKVSYNNRLIRMPLGLLAGAPLGLLSGIVLGHVFHTTDDKGYPDVSNITIEMTFVGTLAGIIVSCIIGYNYIYQFNP